ncbi:baculoviral IAP repeat-containing protein 7-like [Mercenaria mercenaria]|uniref:baculoviral IAP repeat-containing protein 7-like n=1 Tax=Mercenaria mercenaria TaxID=6596 RepID=UPI00234E805D|nr:baculoviral IAP repeat-containing protein 7-like [Mercenaria mercenaria]
MASLENLYQMAGVHPGENVTGEDIQAYFRNRRNQGNRIEHDGNNTSTGLRSEVPRNGGQRSKCDSLGILIGKPKYRQYCTIDSRIKSFEKWPKGKTQDIKQLAEAGFAYTGVDDSVRCFYCSIGLRDWPNGACPWEQHILASEECGHVIQCRGKAYVRKILGESDQDSDVEVDDSNEFVDTVKEAMHRNQEAVFAAREYCENEELLRRAVKSLIKNNIQKENIQKQISAVELVKAIQEIEERNIEQTDTTKQVPENKKPDNIETDGEASESEEEASESEEDIEETNRKLKDPVTCKICFNAIACIITLPCGHMVCCSQCIPALTKCAVCRAQIKGTVRALMAV